MPEQKLTVKQKLFVDYYIQTKGNASEAARLAGYSPKTAFRTGQENMQRPAIQAALASRTAELENERTADTQEILEYLASVMRGETVEEVVVNVGTGKGYTKPEKVKVQVSAKERLKAAEMLAKVKGMFITKAELDVQGALPVVIRDDI
ncbi:MAG: terminase small subunit [Selenomonadaceae bacterium]|nr:terminase small subunit [Selenomonadaceae bacterium]